MKRTCCLVIALSLAFPVFAVDQSKERKRLEACGQVLKEILDIPDGIPKELLNKAECVIVIPSVLKFAIGIGGDYGRGAISRHSSPHFYVSSQPPSFLSLVSWNNCLQLS